jgi:hypothetical protein
MPGGVGRIDSPPAPATGSAPTTSASESPGEAAPPERVAARARPTPQSRSSARGSRILFAALGGVVVVAAAGVGIFLGLRNGASATPSPSASASVAAALPLPAVSADPNAPPFPVPAGAILVNAQADATTAAAFRFDTWDSPLAFSGTLSYYAGLHDPRWTASTPLSETSLGAQATFRDGQGVYDRAVLVLDRTTPVRITVQFVPAGSPSASANPSSGGTIHFGPLPAATALPAGFPAWLVPTSGTLVNAGAMSGTDFAIFASSADIASLLTTYQAALGGHAQGVTVTSSGPSRTIAFTIAGRPGLAALDPAVAGGTTVSIEVTP